MEGSSSHNKEIGAEMKPLSEFTVYGLYTEDRLFFAGDGRMILKVDMIDITLAGEEYSEIEGLRRYLGAFVPKNAGVDEIYAATGGFSKPVEVIGSHRIKAFITRVDGRGILLESTGATTW